MDKLITVFSLIAILLTLGLTFCSDDRMSQQLLSEQQLDREISKMLNEDRGEEHDRQTKQTDH